MIDERRISNTEHRMMNDKEMKRYLPAGRQEAMMRTTPTSRHSTLQTTKAKGIRLRPDIGTSSDEERQKGKMEKWNGGMME